jgi:hypothetical protein
MGKSLFNLVEGITTGISRAFLSVGWMPLLAQVF